MIHYHCADIHPLTKFLELKGRNLLISYAYPKRVVEAHQVGQSVLLDNGAFTIWRQGSKADWPGFYAWCDEWLACPTTWAIVPDVVDAGADAQDALLKEWPHGNRGSPVWHTDEPLNRLLCLVDEWPRVGQHPFDQCRQLAAGHGWGFQCRFQEWPSAVAAWFKDAGR